MRVSRGSVAMKRGLCSTVRSVLAVLCRRADRLFILCWLCFFQTRTPQHVRSPHGLAPDQNSQKFRLGDQCSILYTSIIFLCSLSSRSCPCALFACTATPQFIFDSFSVYFNRNKDPIRHRKATACNIALIKKKSISLKLPIIANFEMKQHSASLMLMGSRTASCDSFDSFVAVQAPTLTL